MGAGAMAFFSRHLSRSAGAAAACALMGGAIWLGGCGEEPRSIDGANLESALPEQLTARLDGLRVTEVDCVDLASTRTRCFARGRGPEGTFELPVTVVSRDGRRVWEVAQADVLAARRGEPRRSLPIGAATTVEGEEGVELRVRLTELIDPLDVGYREIPPMPGSRYVGVALTIANRGSEPYTGTPGSQVTLRVSDGGLLAPAFISEGPCRTASLARVYLEPGERVRGCVAFEVSDRVRPESVALDLGSGRRMVEWRLEPRRGSG